MPNRIGNAQRVPASTVGAWSCVPEQLLTLLLFLIPLTAFTVVGQGTNQAIGKLTETNQAVPQLGARWTNSLGMPFAPVPGTKVLFGIWDVRVKDYAVYAAANPGVAGYWTNVYFSQDATHPVVNVSWDDAKAFCAWLTKLEQEKGMLAAGQMYRLPTDAEWSYAVGIGDKEGNGTPKDKDGKLKDVYPWGNQWPPPKGVGNYSRTLGVDDYEHTSPVGSFPANQYGLYDMGGNVWQWCEDWYDRNQKYRVLRGGAYFGYGSRSLQSSYRKYESPWGPYRECGFRLAVTVAAAPPLWLAPLRPLPPVQMPRNFP